ncbi:MAG: exodeoxyribonuclease VII large subunit [Nitrospirota bacterium]|nr:exodeoxyribonuclease VII large subunit [Nitrospirota bacterium]
MPEAGTDPSGLPAREILSVAELTRRVREILEGQIGTVWLVGEVSGLRTPPSGHMYLTLKDAEAQIRAVVWGSTARYLTHRPADGERILCRARITVYEPRGDYQVVIDYLETAGAGDLFRQFEELRLRLSAEGLFDPERKHPLPMVPRRVAVVTSPTGAALRDVISVLGRRAAGLPVLLVPALVQGRDAPSQLTEALGLAATQKDVDVILLVRGGGSPEDLAAFNDEALARAIAACPVPVIAGVGHETDVSIADFAADLRAPTPSAAAELVSAGWLELVTRTGELARRMDAAMGALLTREQNRLRHARSGLTDPRERLRHLMQRTDDLQLHLSRAFGLRLAVSRQRLMTLSARVFAAAPVARLAVGESQVNGLILRLRGAMEHTLERARTRVDRNAGRLDALSPLKVLGRGYAVATRNGQVLTDALEAAPGDAITVRLRKGELDCAVTGTRADDGDGRRNN